MKNAIILHGAGESPDSYWLPYIQRELEKKGYEVWAPQLPGAENPILSAQLPFVLNSGKFSKDTVIIAHSAGVPLTLGVLENINQRIAQAILVAGFCTPIPEGPNEILKKQYDWKLIQKHVNDLIFIHSDNDPWHCDDTQGRYMFDHLGGTLILKHGEGHMGSVKFKQPYPEFPLLLKLLAD